MIILGIGLIVLSALSNMSVVGFFNSSDAAYFAKHYSSIDCMEARPLTLKDDLPNYLHDRLVASYDCSAADMSQVRLVHRMTLIAPMILIFGLALSQMFRSNTRTPFKEETVEVDCAICGAILGEVPEGERNQLNLNEQYCERHKHEHQLGKDLVCIWNGCEAFFTRDRWIHPV